MSWFLEIKQAAQKLKSALNPYLGSKKAWERKAITSAWIMAHAIEVVVNTFLVMQAEETNENEVSSTLTTIGNIAFNGMMYAFTVSLSNYMVHSIQDALTEANAEKGWLENDASIGIDFIQTQGEGKEHALTADTPVERVLIEHQKLLSKGTVKLFVENVNRMLSSAVGLYVIGRLTSPTTAAFYLVVGGGLVTICCKMDKKKIDMAMEISGHDDTLNARMTHIRERAPQVLALNGARYEAEIIQSILDKRINLAKKTLVQEGRNNTVMYITFFGLGPLLSGLATLIPSILQAPPSGSVAALLFQQNVFQLMINFFLTMENYTQEYPKFGASLTKVYDLQQLLTMWKNFQIRKQLQQIYNAAQQNLELKDFSVSMPTRDEAEPFRQLLIDVNLTLTPGVYHLQGASNAGKSTTFKALMGLWPHTSGEVTYPCDKKDIRFIPQETFIPYDSTLFEMLIYPAKSTADFDRNEVIQLMTTLNLAHLIPTLDQKKDLKMLSRGEQQRLAIIGAILAKPKLLFMDEATASIDDNNKRAAEALLQQCLPHTMIVVIDHSPLNKTEKLEEKSALDSEPVHWVIDISDDEQAEVEVVAEAKSVERFNAPVSPAQLNHSVMFGVRNIVIDPEQKKLNFVPEERRSHVRGFV